MGAMADLEAAWETKNYAAIILDSPFLSLRDTVVHHSWLLFKLPQYPFPSLFLFWFEREAGFDPARLDARKAIQKIEPVPLLIIASEGDQRMGPGVAQELYDLSKSPLKKLEIFGRDVPHGAAARLHPEQYTSLVKNFLERAIGQESGRGSPPGATEPSAAADFPK